MDEQTTLRLTLTALLLIGAPLAADGEPRTSILVGAQVDASPRRPYVVWWDGAPSGALVGLWNSDPRLGDAEPIVQYYLSVDEGSGWWDTGISAEDSHNDVPSFEPLELGLWAAVVPPGSPPQGVSSLATRPRWMEEHRAALGPLTLTRLFLPGTHDSGAYKLYSAADRVTTDGQQPRETLIDKYSVAQEESVLWQLVFGIRYLDLRVAYYPLTPEIWWLNHGLVRFRPLAEVLQDIITFIQNTNEIVLLDFHEFPVGFRQQGRRIGSVHRQLLEFLRQQLGTLAAPNNNGWSGTTLESMWQSGRRLVVSYNDLSTVSASGNFLWSPVSQKWGDVRTLEDLHDYLQRLYVSPPAGPWAAMAELTPNTLDVLLDRLGGLRRMADLVNRNVTAWYRGMWGQTVNSVAVDFFRGTAVVEAAIDWNLQRSAKVWSSKNCPPQLQPLLPTAQ